MKLSRQVTVLKETARKAVHRNEITTEGAADYGGPVLDWFVVHGIKLDGTVRIISGRPTRTNMNAVEVRDFLRDNALTLLKEQAVELARKQEQLLHRDEIQDLLEQKGEVQSEAERKKISELVKQLRTEAQDVDPRELQSIRSQAKEIDDVTTGLLRRMRKPALLTAETYIFDDVMLVQIGRMEFSMVDYGKVNLQTQQVYVYGMLSELPEPIDLGGRKFRFCIFDPWDTRDIEDGGVIQTISLTHEDRQAFFEWVKRLFTFTSFLKVSQQRAAFATENAALKEALKERAEKIGEIGRVVEDLKDQLVLAGAGILNVSSILVSLLISVGGMGSLGFLIGVGFAALLGSSVITTDQNVFNDTSHSLIRIDHLVTQTPNPYASILPGVTTLAFMFLGIMISSRRWGHKTT
jgi:hypothetical protein